MNQVKCVSFSARETRTCLPCKRRVPREIEIFSRKVRLGEKKAKTDKHGVQKEPPTMSMEEGKVRAGVHERREGVTNNLILKITKMSGYHFKQFQFYLVFAFAL